MKPTGKTYNSIEEMIEGTGASVEFIREFEYYSAKRKFRKKLSILRTLANLSEKELAKKIGTKTSFVEQIESSVDDELKIGDIKLYLKGLDYELKLDVEKIH